MHRNFIFTAIMAACFFFSCGTKENAGGTDSTKNDTATKHGITVNEPVTGEPHKTKDSVYDGESIERYDNGVIYMRGDVRSGLRHGEWLTFYRDGKVWSKGTYINGYREGYGVSYHPNGNKSSEGYYKHDRPVGHWKYWTEDGHVTEHDFKGDTTGMPVK